MSKNDILRHIWPEWTIEGKPLGRGSYGVVYKAVRRDHNIESYAAIKVISIPSDPSDIDSLRSEGMDMNATRTYLEGIVNDFVGEIQLMESLKGVQNIVSVEDYKVVERTDEIGWDIFIRMELLTPLNNYIVNRPLTENQVIKLGVDLCTALELCARKNIIHRDIKPENIFVNQFGDFKLGDFGVARKLENLTAGLSQKGTYNYMAPEVVRGGVYDATADLYSLGLVLYRFTNKNRLPFMDTSQQPLTPNARTAATRRRLDGEALPLPCEASPALARVIMCACAPDPRARFASATAMKKALLFAANGSNAPAAQDGAALEKTVAVHRPVQRTDPDKTAAVRRAPQNPQQVQQAPRPVSQPALQTRPQPQAKKKRTWLIILLSAVLATLVLGAAVCLFLLPRILSPKDDTDEGTVTVSSEKPSDGKQEKSEQKNSDPASASDSESEQEQEPEPVPPPDVSGQWVDTAQETAFISAEKLSDETYSFEISASQPNNVQETWLITAQWDETQEKYTYLGGVKQVIQMDGITPVPTMAYSDGSGSFSYADGRLYWEDLKENAGAGRTFSGQGSVGADQFQTIMTRATQPPMAAALLVSAPDVSGESLQPASVASAWATSTIVQEKCSNDPILLFDGDDTTSWQEGVDGYGEGESVTATLSRSYEVRYLSFKMGNWRNDYYYQGNSKPKTLTITVGDYTTQITFEDAKKVQWVGFSRAVPASSITIRIDEVYTGTSWKDTAICEMTIYGK